jgi:hypothetical protein
MDNQDTRLKVRIVHDVVEHPGPNALSVASAKHVGRSNEQVLDTRATPVSLLPSASARPKSTRLRSMAGSLQWLLQQYAGNHFFLSSTSFTDEGKSRRNGRSLYNFLRTLEMPLQRHEPACVIHAQY